MKTEISTQSANKAIVSSKGQVVIPMEVRKKLGIHVGHELYFIIRSDGVIEIKQKKRSINMFFGRCKRKHEKPMTIKQMDEAIMKAVSEE